MRTSKPQPRRRNQRIQALFEAARELSPAQQASFLDRECADDFGIRLEIEGILAAARGPTDQRLRKLVDDEHTLLDDHTMKARPARNEPESPADAATLLPEPGTRIGQYELVRELGRGGMAVVYESENGRALGAACPEGPRNASPGHDPPVAAPEPYTLAS